MIRINKSINIHIMEKQWRNRQIISGNHTGGYRLTLHERTWYIHNPTCINPNKWKLGFSMEVKIVAMCLWEEEEGSRDKTGQERGPGFLTEHRTEHLLTSFLYSSFVLPNYIPVPTWWCNIFSQALILLILPQKDCVVTQDWKPGTKWSLLHRFLWNKHYWASLRLCPSCYYVFVLTNAVIKPEVVLPF
jgi:hypothetical protein